MFRQRNSFGCILRMIPFELPTAEELNIPSQVVSLASCERGLVLIAGNSGSGKTTTMAVLLREISRLRPGGLIITLDNPLEYLHHHDKAMIIQREIYTDTRDYASGIASSFYQRPDVMMVSDVPDAQVARSLLQVAQSGRLLVTSVYGGSAVDALRGFLNMYPRDEQDGACVMLADVLRAVVFQCLVPDLTGKLVPAFEVVGMEETLSAMLREKRLEDLQTAIQGSRTNTVVSLDRSLADLYRQQKISRETVLKNAVNRNSILRQLY